MAALPPITVRQPRPYDLVNDPLLVSGIATGFEGGITARVRDANGAVLVETPLHVGSNGTLANFHTALRLRSGTLTPQGTLEVFESSAKDGSEINKITVLVIFGRALVPDYHGFGQHTVARGETLGTIAKHYYNSAALYGRIFEANRDQLTNPDRISVGQVLRIPQ